MELPIFMTKEYWMNSQLSIARFTGGFNFQGKEWLIVPQANDLIRLDFLEYYYKLGRDRFIEVLKEHQQATDDELFEIYKGLTRPKPKKKQEEETINFE